MGRHLAAIQEWEEYIPDVDGERDLYRDEPGEEIRHLSRMDLKRFQRSFERMQRTGGGATKADEKMLAELFSANVRNVRNYSVGDIEISTGAELWEHGDIDVTTDVAGALVNRAQLDKGLAKKLRSGSGSSSSRPERSSGGGAQGATLLYQGTTQETQGQTTLS